MGKLNTSRIALALVGALSVAACGGGSGGGPEYASAPPPLPPSPPPLAVPPDPGGAVGVESDSAFVVQSAWSDGWGTVETGDPGVEISYSSVTGDYNVTLPGGAPGTLNQAGVNGSYDATGWLTITSTWGTVLGADGEPTGEYYSLGHPSSSPFTYTGFGTWTRSCALACPNGNFAYGIPTAAGDVPISGSAEYLGELHGVTDYGVVVVGSVELDFDFAAGTLSGAMNPAYYPVWDQVSLGTYTFRDTIFASGSTSFSGSFIAPGNLAGPSWFTGMFTGPGAAELLASWQAPYSDPATSYTGTMGGVWIAVRDD